MRKLIFIVLASMITISLSACNTDDIYTPEAPQQPENSNNEKEENNPHESMKLKITVGSTIFAATLQENTTTNAFKKLLPMTIKMSDLSNNEKYYNLQNSLPTNSSNPETIQSGDLMLYGSQTLVLFYKNFPTSYSYTQIGRIDNPKDLPSALGSGNITVTFELEQNKNYRE